MRTHIVATIISLLIITSGAGPALAGPSLATTPAGTTAADATGVTPVADVTTAANESVSTTNDTASTANESVPPADSASATPTVSPDSASTGGDKRLEPTTLNFAPPRSTASGDALAIPASPNGTAPERVTVVIETTGATSARLSTLEEFGATVQAVHGDYVQARIAVADVSRYSDQSWVSNVRLPARPRPTTISEGVGTIDADELHARGITGDSVKVGVLDQGFDPSNAEIADNVAAYESFTSAGIENDGTNRHGTAVAEIVVDVAPHADLYLANFGTGVEYGNAVDWMKQQDVDVIVMSMSFFEQPYDGTGLVSSVADDAAGDGIVWVNSAGNAAEEHWQGNFEDSDGDQWMEFQGDYETNSLNDGETIPGGTPITVSLNWDAWPSTDADYDLYLLDSNKNVVASSEVRQNGYTRPVESFTTTAPYTDSYQIAVANAGADGSHDVEIFAIRGGPLYFSDPTSSIAAPAVGRNVTTVGAYYHGTGNLESFSSHGPTNDGRRGLDVTAPDGVSTDAYGTFYGTSAAAPHVGGVAALLLDDDPMLDREGVEAALRSSATDMEAAGPDTATGYGAVEAAAALDTTNPKVTGVSLERSTTAVGTPVNGTVTVENTADAGGSLALSFVVDGDVVGIESISVPASTVRTYQFWLGFEDSGTHTVSVNGRDETAIEAVDVQPVAVDYAVNTTIPDVGDDVRVDATLTNPADLKQQTAVTVVADGVVVSNRTVLVGPNGLRTVTETVSFATAGTHTVTVNEKRETALDVRKRQVELTLSANRTRVIAGQTVEFAVTNDTGDLVSGTVSVDGASYATGDDGVVEVVLDSAGEFTATATKADTPRTGYVAGERSVTVLPPIQVDDQSYPDATGQVRVASASYAGGDFAVAIHNASAGSPGPIVGWANLSAGINERVPVTLDERIDSAVTVTAMLHESFEGAPITRDGSPLADTAEISITDSPTVGANPARDPDGDGTYEDVTGDGAFNIIDVGLFLQERNGDAVQSNVAAFDFTGDGSVNIIDVGKLLAMSQA